MFGGGGGLNPRKMQQMMEQMGIDVDEIDATEVIIRTEEADLVFDDPSVTQMNARGQETYQIVGSPEERAPGSTQADTGSSQADAEDAATSAIPDEDVEMVAARTGASEDDAREALERNDGDLAAAVAELE